MERLVYLDNAATTFPKPIAVVDTVTKTLRHSCGNPGRSSHRLSMSASDIVYECRSKIADFFGSKDERVIFTSSATHSLNLAVKTSLRKGDHILISHIEHNALYRPVFALAQKKLITFDIYSVFPSENETILQIQKLIRPNTSMICACHHSNICNILAPVSAIGKFCRKRNILFLVDASQSAGTIPIDMESDFIDILCAPAHKGMYGIPGLGFTVFGSRFEDNTEYKLDTFIEGGNGIRSSDPRMPDFLPERLESGTVGVPAIAALSKGIDFIKRRTITSIHKEECKLCQRLRANLMSMPSVELYADNFPGSILLFNINNFPPEKLAETLDKYKICVRSGLHCAPLAHKKLGTRC